jgi:hypothetical protein
MQMKPHDENIKFFILQKGWCYVLPPYSELKSLWGFVRFQNWSSCAKFGLYWMFLPPRMIMALLASEAGLWLPRPGIKRASFPSPEALFKQIVAWLPIVYASCCFLLLCHSSARRAPRSSCSAFHPLAVRPALAALPSLHRSPCAHACMEESERSQENE